MRVPPFVESGRHHPERRRRRKRLVSMVSLPGETISAGAYVHPLRL